jgi:dienelactone hydrolase
MYGSDDPLIAPETIDAAQDRNQNGQWLLYDGARHDFLNDSGDEYDPGAEADAVERMTQFFSSTLPRPQTVDLG